MERFRDLREEEFEDEDEIYEDNWREFEGEFFVEAEDGTYEQFDTYEEAEAAADEIIANLEDGDNICVKVVFVPHQGPEEGFIVWKDGYECFKLNW